MTLLDQLPAGAFSEGSVWTTVDAAFVTATARRVTGNPLVRVVLGPHHPSTDLTRQVIFLPDPAALDAERYSRALPFLRGALYHECAHLLFTAVDPEYWPAVVGQVAGTSEASRRIQTLRPKYGPLFSETLVILEDVRVDRLMMAARPGLARSQRAFLRVVESLDGDPVARLSAAPPREQFLGVLLAVGREAVTVAQLPEPLRAFTVAVRGVLDRAFEARTPPDLVESAAALLDELHGRAETAVETPGEPGCSAERFALDVLTQPEKHAGSRCVCEGGALREVFQTILDEAAAGASARQDGAPGGASTGGRPEEPFPEYRVATRAFDVVETFDRDRRREGRETYRAACAEARRVVGRLVDNLDLLLRARAAPRSKRGCPVGATLDPGEFPNIAMGLAGSDVWIDSSRAKRLDLACALLVDCSGSMRSEAGSERTRAELARMCAAALHLALTPASVPHAILGFTTCSPTELHRDLARRRAEGESFAEVARSRNALRHLVFKGFDDTDAYAIAAIEPYADNMDGEAVAWASGLLRARSERKRLLFVLSDGEPAGGDHGPTEAHHLSAMVRAAEASGIRTIALGIGTDAVARHYPEWVQVQDVGELPRALLSVLRRVV